ncbi:hypothetical protein AAC387_Pa03g4239 [Persea americana]
MAIIESSPSSSIFHEQDMGKAIPNLAFSATMAGWENDWSHQQLEMGKLLQQSIFSQQRCRWPCLTFL